jgi:hypothetical protein
LGSLAGRGAAPQVEVHRPGTRRQDASFHGLVYDEPQVSDNDTHRVATHEREGLARDGARGVRRALPLSTSTWPQSRPANSIDARKQCCRRNRRALRPCYIRRVKVVRREIAGGPMVVVWAAARYVPDTSTCGRQPTEAAGLAAALANASTAARSVLVAVPHQRSAAAAGGLSAAASVEFANGQPLGWPGERKGLGRQEFRWSDAAAGWRALF